MSFFPTPNAGKDQTKDPEEADKPSESVLKTKRLLKPMGPKQRGYLRIAESPKTRVPKRFHHL